MKRRAGIIALIITTIIWLVFAQKPASAGEVEYFIMCQPDSFVWVRERARKHSAKTGYLMLGDRIRSDGRTHNGFIHVLGVTESDEGWISCGYLAEDEPEIAEQTARITSRGRVACRRSINGARRKWLRNGDEVTVYAWGPEWCVTNEGFIRNEYLETFEASTETGGWS